jgi:hypothetical protein
LIISPPLRTDNFLQQLFILMNGQDQHRISAAISESCRLLTPPIQAAEVHDQNIRL